MTKSRFAHTCESCDPSAAADVSIQITMLLRLHLLGTIRNKATNGACPHATLSEVLMSDSHAHSPCRQHACAHAPSGRMQSSGTGLPLLPRWARDSRCGTEIPSMHVIAASSPGTRSRGDRRRAHIIKTCPFRHPPPTPPHSPARHSPRQPYEPPVGGIHLEVSYLPASACISLHLPASPIADIGASRGAHHGANPRATRRSSRRRMASCPPSDTVLPRRSLRAREEAGAASR
jgi:hypothetical protein